MGLVRSEGVGPGARGALEIVAKWFGDPFPGSHEGLVEGPGAHSEAEARRVVNENLRVPLRSKRRPDQRDTSSGASKLSADRAWDRLNIVSGRPYESISVAQDAKHRSTQ